MFYVQYKYKIKSRRIKEILACYLQHSFLEEEE